MSQRVRRRDFEWVIANDKAWIDERCPKGGAKTPNDGIKRIQVVDWKARDEKLVPMIQTLHAQLQVEGATVNRCIPLAEIARKLDIPVATFNKVSLSKLPSTAKTLRDLGLIGCR